MIQKDIPIIERFLGTTEVSEMISPLGCCRLYSRHGAYDPFDYTAFLLILTPMMHDEETIERTSGFIIGCAATYGIKIKVKEHQVGRNYAYTFEKVD